MPLEPADEPVVGAGLLDRLVGGGQCGVRLALLGQRQREVEVEEHLGGCAGSGQGVAANGFDLRRLACPPEHIDERDVRVPLGLVRGAAERLPELDDGEVQLVVPGGQGAEEVVGARARLVPAFRSSAAARRSAATPPGSPASASATARALSAASAFAASVAGVSGLSLSFFLSSSRAKERSRSLMISPGRPVFRCDRTTTPITTGSAVTRVTAANRSSAAARVSGSAAISAARTAASGRFSLSRSASAWSAGTTSSLRPAAASSRASRWYGSGGAAEL